MHRLHVCASNRVGNRLYQDTTESREMNLPLLRQIMSDPNVAEVHIAHRPRWFPFIWRSTHLVAPTDWPSQVSKPDHHNRLEAALAEK